MDGGPGADTFVFEPGNGNDYIMDFTTVLMTRSTSARSPLADGAAVVIIERTSVTAPTGDDNYVIDLSEFGGGTITLLGVTTTDTDDFFFGS